MGVDRTEAESLANIINMIEIPSSLRHGFIKRFCVAFALGAIPGFMYGFLYERSFFEICFIGLSLGLTCGVLAALFGRWMLDLLVILFKSGWS